MTAQPATASPVTVAATPDAVDQAAQAPAAAVTGLTEQEARERRARGLGNRVKLASNRTIWQIVRDNVLTFINITLLGVGVILIAMGQTKDAILASGLVVLNGLVGVVQEVRAKQRLDRIALLNRATATVIRDGTERTVDPDEIVVDDVLAVRPGDQIFVDGRVVGDGAIDVDESLLTGETDPVPKRAGDPVYSGSHCVAGAGRYQAEKVGSESRIATVTASARAYRAKLTPLQLNVNLIIRLLLVVAGFLLAMILLGSVIWDYPIADTVLAAAVVLGIVPSGLFLMIIITYSLAAVRLAAQNALIQQANAIESLSNVNVFCMDKTGTLTANKLNLVDIVPIGLDQERVHSLLGDFAASSTGGTKTSEAIAAACGGQQRPLTDEIPFSSARKWSAVAADTDGFRGVFALGAPEFLAPLLANSEELQPPSGWAERGLRILLFAQAPAVAPLHDESGEARLPDGVAAAAWLGFADELRPNCRETIDGFRRAGITLKIISGDNPETVAALARQAGLPADAKLVSGLELDQMDDAEFAQAAVETTVFGRVTPEQKERLVQVLRGHGFYVAMTGDGVNDVLSLKKAQLGIAMQSGSQATRNVADIILLNDSFSALPAAFREGQRIRRGLQAILALFLTRVFTVALVILAVLIVEAGFPFSPGHISVLTVLTVGIPTFGLALWATSGPAPVSLGRSLIQFVLPASVLLAIAGFAVYALFYFWHDVDLPSLRAGGVAGATVLPAADRFARDALAAVLILGGLVLVVFAAPPTRWWAVVEDAVDDWRPTLLALAMLPLYAVILIVPELRRFFGLNLLDPLDYAVIGLVVVAWALLLRLVWRTRAFDRFFGYAEPT